MLSLLPIREQDLANNAGMGPQLCLLEEDVPILMALIFQTDYGMNALRAGQLSWMFTESLTMNVLATGVMNYFGLRSTRVVNGALNELASSKIP